MFNSNCYTTEELKKIFKFVGENVKIDKSSIFINTENISIGSNVRIDAFCHFSVKELTICDYVHIAPYCQFSGGGKIIINNFCGISSRVSLFTSSDDYVSGFMTNPMVPEKFRNVKTANIVLEKHVIVGCGSVVLPGIVLKEGSSVGALTLITKNIPIGAVVSGVPQKLICKRNLNKLKELESEF